MVLILAREASISLGEFVHEKIARNQFNAMVGRRAALVGAGPELPRPFQIDRK